VLNGEFDDQFPIDCFHAGSGTSSNMNVNEVMANIATESLGGKRGDRGLVHPNDDVNKGQSTNNIFPSAIRVANVDLPRARAERLAAAHCGAGGQGGRVRRRDQKRAHPFAGRGAGDAGPGVRGLGARLTKGGEAHRARARRRFWKWARRQRHRHRGEHQEGVPPLIAEDLAEFTGDAYRPAENGIEITQFLTDKAELSSALRLAAMDIGKICNDLRLMCSGPNTGFAEIVLPPVEPGSSIMPGKINPSIAEATNMAMIQIVGNDAAVQAACAAGQLELNTHMPVTGLNLVKSQRILTRAAIGLAEKCIAGIKANRERCYTYFETSGGLATIFNPKLGYDKVSALVKESLATKKTARQIVVEKGLLTDAEFEALVKGTPPGRICRGLTPFRGYLFLRKGKVRFALHKYDCVNSTTHKRPSRSLQEHCNGGVGWLGLDLRL
jgi:aspartate ammonia-lyase